VFVLLNPIAAVVIVLPPLIYESRWVSKVVFTPNPTKEDFAAVAICDIDRIAYVTAGAWRWAVMDHVCITCGDQLTDVVYNDKGKVYCLTRCGDVQCSASPSANARNLPTSMRLAPRSQSLVCFTHCQTCQYIHYAQPCSLINLLLDLKDHI
jgi:hypothetical protein